MNYYVSEFAPFTIQDEVQIKDLLKKGEVTLLFLNENFDAFETKLYLKQIMKELGCELPYIQINEEQLKKYTAETIYTSEKKEVVIGFEDQSFIEHHIFDDISETMAAYIVKNEMFGITKHIRLIFNVMSYYRFKHTMRVTYRMKQLIALYDDLEPETAYLTALFHDYAKEMPQDDLKMIMNHHFQEYIDSPEQAWHGFVGAFELTQMDSEVDDDMYEAISFHTIGIPRMSNLGLALFVADFCDFGRQESEHWNWQEVWKAAQSSLGDAARIRLEQSVEYFTKIDKPLYWTTTNMLEWLNDPEEQESNN